jgi:hypothetical protein
LFAAAHGSPSEEDCLRFLRARDFNRVSALEMLRRTHNWRTLNDVNNLLAKEPEDPHEAVFQAICPHLNQGYDKQGFPIYIERTGRVDVHKLTSVLSFDLVIKRHIRHM